MSKAVAALESLVFDLIHKPITKEVVTRVLTHDLLTSETAEQAVDVLYRKEALDADNYYLYLAFYARHGDIQKVKDGIEKANEIYKIPPPTDKWHSSLARAYSAQGRVPDALRHLNAARALNPNHCDVRAHDAVITSLIGRAREIQQELMVYKRNKGGRERDPNVEFMETESDRRSSELLLLAVDV